VPKRKLRLRLPNGTRVISKDTLVTLKSWLKASPLFAFNLVNRDRWVAGLDADQLRHGAFGRIDYRCDIASAPVADGEFDAILCTEALEHVREAIKVVQEMARIVKPGGRLILTAPLGSGIHQEPYHYYGGYTSYWYQDFLAAAGFSQIKASRRGGRIPERGIRRHKWNQGGTPPVGGTGRIQ
jgi:SAM-dependent methyltransferase